MDDPRLSLLFDPQSEPAADNPSSTGGQAQEPSAASGQPSPFQLVKFEEQQPAPPPAEGGIRGPRSTVTAEALEQLGVIVIKGENAADVEEVIRIIEYIQKLGSIAEIQLQIVPLEYADATSVANTLTQVYQRVIVNASGNVRAPLTPAAGQQQQQQQGQPGQQPQPGQPGAQQPQQQGQPVQQTQLQQLASVTLVSLPRFNAILLAAPRSRVEDVVKEIKRLDRPSTPQGQALPFPLKKASAARVDALITNFYNQRYPNETMAQHQIRVTHDDNSNTVFVQAAPGDMAEIRILIERIDTTVSSAVNDVRIVRLNNALADELSALLFQAISQGVVAPSPLGGPGTVSGAGGPAAARPPGAAPGIPQPAPGQPSPVPQQAAGTPGQLGAATKTTSLRFISARRDAPGAVESGLLEDIHVTPDIRTNSFILSAPAKTMDLLLALIRELDVLPAARAEVNIFPLKKADAAVTADTLRQLFLGTGGLGGQRPGVTTPAPAPSSSGAPGTPNLLSAVQTPQVQGGGAFPSGGPRPVFTLGGVTPEGTPLVELRITTDERTNSLIVGGSRNDLDVIAALISRLEDSDVQIRQNQVYRLRNLAAVDAATALNNFLKSSLAVLSQGQQLTYFQEIQRDVVIVPEPINNQLLISATPRYFAEILHLIEELDAQPPQVMIQVLVAEVDLSNTQEFGVELGLQSPVLFQRSVYAPGNYNFVPAGLAGILPAGVTINNSLSPVAVPGYNFNNTQPLGNSALAANPGIVGFQGINNLGVGRVSPTSGVGGFVFSANSDAFNLLIRALKTQGRVEVLSRPQIMTLDNQTAVINVGQEIPIVTGSNVVPPGIVSNIVDRVKVGVNLTVTPKISPDGTVLMRVIPEVSSKDPVPVDLGNGQLSTTLNIQHVETTVLAHDGETVAIGGMISKHDMRNENKVPWFGDLPYLGVLFRYRTQNLSKTELLVILTPHIVRSPLEADHILAEEARRMDWTLGDVVKIHGTTGLEPILPPPPGGRPGDPGSCRETPPVGAGPVLPGELSRPPLINPEKELPVRPQPGFLDPVQGQAPLPSGPVGVAPVSSGAPAGSPAAAGPALPPPVTPPPPAESSPGDGSPNPPATGKESRVWTFPRKN